MPALQVRDFPDELYEELRKRAQQEHRSIAQQTIVAIQESLINAEISGSQQKKSDMVPDYIEKRKKIFERIDALPSLEIPDDFPSSVEIIREMRDSR